MQGIKNVPTRIRVKVERKRSQDDEAEDALYSLVTYLPVKKGEFAGLQTKAAELDNE